MNEGKIIAAAKAVYMEAHAAGQAGKFMDEAWMGSAARTRLMRPAADASAARDRRDRVLYFFEEGLRDGHESMPAEGAWARSYSLVIARDLAERAVLKEAA